ncbi:MAG: DNA polymerase III subunit beta [Desulfovibrio sp.]|nr:DNA polymerase III subunit beta [Desulfovibrio sp.]
MKLILNTERVIGGIQKALSVIPTKTGAAFLRALWIKAEGDRVSFYSTDASIEFMGTYPAEVIEEGIIGVQAQIFYGLMSTCRENVKLEHKEADGTVSIVHKNGRCKLPVMSSDWFQQLQSFPETDSIVWRGDFFKLIVDKISYCIKESNDITAFYCIYFNKNSDNKIDICSLNGHQFSMLRFQHDDFFVKIPDKGILIQKNYLALIAKIIGNEEININFSENRLFVKNNFNEIISIPLSNFDFPNYSNFLGRLADESISTLKINRKDLLEALNRISTINNDNTSCTDFFFSENNDYITCSGVADNYGEVSEKINIQYNGNIKKITFRTIEIINIIEHFDSEELILHLTSDEGPCSFEGKDDPFYVVVVMPIRTREVTYEEQEEY